MFDKYIFCHAEWSVRVACPLGTQRNEASQKHTANRDSKRKRTLRERFTSFRTPSSFGAATLTEKQATE